MLYHLYYFSGTGNTEDGVRRISDTLRKSGHSVRTVYITRKSRPLPEKPDRLILAYPTYAWHPPALVTRFVARLPAGGGTPSAVFTADGGGSYGSLDSAEKSLRRRGYRTFLKAAAHYPANWVQMSPTPDGQARRAAVERGISGTEAFLQALVSGTPMERERSGIEGLLNFVGILFGAFGRHFLGKLFIADDDCTSCGLCARSCPSGAIVMGKSRKARPRWTLGCESCNRCMNLCPARAINTSLIRGLALVCLSTLVVILGFRLYGGASPFLREFLPSTAAVLADLCTGALIVFAGPVVTVTILDALILRPLLAIPVLRSLARRSFTKKFPRYSFEGFKPPKERPGENPVHAARGKKYKQRRGT